MVLHFVYYWLAFIAQNLKKRKDITDSSCQLIEETPNVVSKKQHLDDDTSCPISSLDKGKMKANDVILPRILSGYEDEITCPMYVCFIIFISLENNK